MLTLKWFFNFIDVINRGFVGMCGIIDGIVYRLVSLLFQLFFSLAKVQLLDNSIYRAIADRVYLFVGIIALFGVSVSLLKAIVNPSELNKSVINSFKSLITSLFLIILMPTIFEYAYSLQGAIIDDDIIGKIFQIDLNEYKKDGESLIQKDSESMFEKCTFADGEIKQVSVKDSSGNEVSGEKEITKKQCEANYITMTVLETFITPEKYDISNNNGTTWAEARDYMIYTGNFNYVATFVDQMYDAKSGESISYTVIISTLSGALLIYVVLSLCIDLGVRAAKLAFYQLISPIPVLMKIIPGKEGQFDKWLKQTISTFLEVFIRLIIINFIIFMCGNLLSIIDSMSGFEEINLIGKAVLIMGLFVFAKQAPKLLGEALGFEGGNLKFGIKGKLAEGGAFTAGAALGAGATALTRNGINAWKEGSKKVANANGFGGKLKAGAGAVVGGLGSTIGGTVSGLARGGKAGWSAKSATEMRKAAGDAAKATVDKRNARAAYKAANGGNTVGVMKGHAMDALNAAKTWATGGVSAILDKVKAEEDFVGAYADVESLFETPQYKAYKAQYDNLKTLKDQGETRTSTGVPIDDAMKKLQGQMLLNRANSMNKNTNEFAYALMNINREAKKNPDLLKSIGIQGANMDALDNFVIKGNQVYNKTTGNSITADDLMHIYEGSGMSGYSISTDASGNTVITDGTNVYDSSATQYLGGITDAKDGVKAQKSKAKNEARNDKISITYKEAIKNQDKK